MKFKPPPKRKKVEEPPSSSASCIPDQTQLARDDIVHNLVSRSTVHDTPARDTVNMGTEPGRATVLSHAMQTSSVDNKIRQARNFAVAQAQQDGCKGNYKVFDSAYGNYLVPVIPTRAELGD